MNLLIFNALSWEQRKLSEVVGTTYGGGTPATSNEDFWNGNIPWIQSSNVVEDQLFDVDVKKHISKNGLNHSAAQLIPGNSVAVVTHVGVGKLVFMQYSYTTSQDFISLGDMICEPKFLCYALYKKLQEDLHIVQGSAIKGITKEDLMSKVISFPEIAEQTMIADTLQNLDHLITLHQSKAGSWKNKKNQLSTISWEQRKCGVLCYMKGRIGWQGLKSSDFISDGPYCVTGTDFDNGRVRWDRCYHVSEERYNMDANIQLRTGDLLITKDGTIGKLAYIDKLHDKACLNSHLLVIRPNDEKEINNQYLFQVFSSELFTKYYTEAGTGSTMKSLPQNVIANFDVPLPGIEEQKKIAFVLSSLDETITLHHRKLNRTQICINRSFLYGSF